jgi:hypothetical protein
MQVIGIAGTAKNTGKTTTTAALIEEIKLTGKLLGLTSIGFDGEETDNVTGLPKPRLLLSVGTLVAIAEKCLAASSAEIQVLMKLGIFTPLGEIIIGRVEAAGMVVIAGPNKAHQLGEVLSQLQAWQPDIVLVDGALNRLAPMVETRGLILATGAARTPDLECLYRETLDLCEVFQWPVLDEKLRKQFFTAGKPAGSELLISVLDQAGRVIVMEGKSLLGNQQVEKLMGLILPTTRAILIPGIVSYTALKALLDCLLIQTVRPVLVFTDPIKLIVSPDFFKLKILLDGWEKAGGNLAILNSLPLLMVTLNPFYPAFDESTGSYTAAFIDGGELRARLSKLLKVPVIDVKKQSAKKVLRQLT